MDYTQDDLNEAKRQIASTIHKLRETILTLEAKEDPRPVQIPDHAGQTQGKSI